MSQIIRCGDRNCNMPVAEVHDDGRVVILSRHHGERHRVEFKVKEPASTARPSRPS